MPARRDEAGWTVKETGKGDWGAYLNGDLVTRVDSEERAREYVSRQPGGAPAPSAA